jgi:hypothetical protein
VKEGGGEGREEEVKGGRIERVWSSELEMRKR